MNYFLEKIKEEYDAVILERFNVNRKSSFRINRILIKDKNEIDEFLKSNNIKYEKPSYFDDAYIVEKKDENFIKESSLYNDGKIYFQNLSTMIPIISYDFKENDNVLDMCAAPGGKTVLLSSIMENKISITSLEIKKPRYEKLVHNINMQKSKSFTMNVDARNLDENFRFDVILLDAPCTGSGTIDINENSDYITKELLDKVNKSQKNLLEKASKIIKKDGIIIYMTCSLFNEENENVVDLFINKNKNFEVLDLSGFRENIIKENKIEIFNYDKDIYKNKLIKILPNEYYEGFFFCVLKKIN